MSATVTVADRIVAHERLTTLNYWAALEAAGEGYQLSRLQHAERHAIRHATYWESFADQYTPQQRRAAVALLAAMTDPEIDREDDEYARRVFAVAALIGAER